MSRSYRQIVADYHRQYPHLIRLTIPADWRFDHYSRAHYQVTHGRLVWWHERDGSSVFGFKTAEQAAAFQRWADTCGIDWTVKPRAQPLPHPEPPPNGRSPTGPVRPGADAIGAETDLPAETGNAAPRC